MAEPLPLAPVSALASWLKVTIDGEDARAGAALRIASALVRAQGGTDWMDGDALVDPLPEGVADVTVMVAARAYKNPLLNSSQTTGPFSATLLGLELTAAEESIIDSAVGAKRLRGLSTITTTRTGSDVTNYVDVTGGDPLPVDLPDRAAGDVLPRGVNW